MQGDGGEDAAAAVDWTAHSALQLACCVALRVFIKCAADADADRRFQTNLLSELPYHFIDVVSLRGTVSLSKGR
jgi:hypothetical protein